MGELQEQPEDQQEGSVPQFEEKNIALRVAMVIALIVLAWIIGVVWLPRWWARRIGNVVDGSLTYGTFLGTFLGVVFTVLPLWAVRFMWRSRHKGWKRVLTWFAVVVLLASPNLTTLGIVVGNGSAAHAGERILDVDGPGFRGGTLVGAVIGVAIFAGLWFLAWSRRRNKEKAALLKAQLEELQ